MDPSEMKAQFKQDFNLKVNQCVNPQTFDVLDLSYILVQILG